MSDVRAGDSVICRTAHGDWVPMIAYSGPRLTRYGKTLHLAIAVGPWGDLQSVNWPAEDVALASRP